MLRTTTRFIYISVFFIFSFTVVNCLPPINLFRPSDRPLMPEYWPCTSTQWTAGFETSVKTKGFRDTFDECQLTDCRTDINSCVNVLQIYQNNQNVLAAFKGFDSSSQIGKLSQLFNINDENGTQGIFVPTGNFKVPINLMFAARYCFNWGFILGFYLPFYSMELNNVRWRKQDCESSVEDQLEKDLIKLVCDISNLNISGWKRKGLGDFLTEMTWLGNFPQNKPLLSNVRVQTRFGVYAPTGKKQDEDKILAIPFGNDGSWGLQFGGGLDLTFGCLVRGGLDAEFLYLFGNTRCRRVKVDCNQTDLLFLTKLPAFREFGLGQQYNIYLETGWGGISLKANYQYLKRNEDRISVFSDKVDPFIVNSAESLQDWTAHSAIFSVIYDAGRDFPDSHWGRPYISGWFKLGFNGKRAILLNTVGAIVTLNF